MSTRPLYWPKSLTQHYSPEKKSIWPKYYKLMYNLTGKSESLNGLLVVIE